MPACAHGCPLCPHPGVGPATLGSKDVNINGRPAIRVNDQGMHAACCGGSQWKAVKGSATVFINGQPAHRLGDTQAHCGGTGQLIEGSNNVFIGDSSGGGSGAPPGPRRGGRGSPEGASRQDTNGATAAAAASAPGRDAPAPRAATPVRNPAVDEGWATPMPDYAPPEPPPIPPEKLFWVDVQLVDQNGEPLAGEDYELELTSGEVRRGKLDADGVVRVEGLEPGICRLRVPDETPPSPPAASPPPAASGATHWIEVELVDQDGAPLTGAPVELRLADGASRATTADARGRVRLDDIAPGTCLLVVPDEPPPRPAAPAPAPPPAPPPAPCWIEVELVDQDGAPLAAAPVELRLADGATRAATTDARGRVRLDDVPPGGCRLVVPDEEPPRPPAPAAPPPPAPAPATGWLELEIVDQDGDPLPRAAFELRLAAGGTRPVITDERGRARLDDLPPGEHALAVPDEPPRS